ncbi:MAG: DUF6161 domain-containing protein [Kordia sp.]|uniref:DUF6161 domain-containing protein n=1 Tax=Kordia sp. TaxID=1965332 RepID=UPI00385E2B8F
MTTTELTRKIAKTKSPKWFNSKEIHLNYPDIKFSQTFKGFASIHKFFSDQVRGWQNTKGNIPNDLMRSKNHFISVKKKIEDFLENFKDQHDRDLNSQWRNAQSIITRNDHFFLYDVPETEFLLKTHKEFPSSFNSAYNFLINKSSTPSNRDSLIGSMLAYEFVLNDFSELPQRRDKEKRSIISLRTKMIDSFSESETQLSDHITNIETQYQEYTQKIDDLKTEKETDISEWFSNHKGNFSKFHKDSLANISKLETTYEKLLSLKKPAEHWRDRAKAMKKEGWKAIYWLVGLVVFTCITLFLLLWLTPKGVLLSFIEDPASAVKWSIVYVTFISFLAFGIRALNKVAFSSFHLARDAEEREQLTSFYLALQNESTVKIDKEQEILIMQSLFSRSDTGLLKDDSGPKMPNDFTGKLFSSK